MDLRRKLRLAYASAYDPNNPLWLMQDIVGCFELWPEYIIDVLSTSTFRYGERIKICSFFYLNGCRDPMDLYRFMIRVKEMATMHSQHKTVIDLFKYWEDEENGTLVNESRELMNIICVFHNSL